MIPAPHFGRYPTRSGDEQFLRFYNQNRNQLVIIEPFFEERNLLRQLIVAVARIVAEREIGVMIPDLPGCAESDRTIRDIRIKDWRDAVADAGSWLHQMTGGSVHVASLRGGALLDDAVSAKSWWRFAPATGHELLRPMRRSSAISNLEISNNGYDLGHDLLKEIELATTTQPPGPMREYSVDHPGIPFWRRAEPGRDPALAEALAQDIITWISQCARD